MLIQTRNNAIEMYKGIMKPTFEEFCKGLINEQDRLIASSQLLNSKALMAHSKNNPNISFNKHTKPHNQGSTSSKDDAFNMVYSKKKVYNP